MMEFVSWDDDYSQLNGKIKFMFQTTNQYIYILYCIYYICTHICILYMYIFVYDYICLCAWHMYWIKLPVSLITFCFITCASSWVAHDSHLDVPWPWRRNQVYTKHESMGKVWEIGNLCSIFWIQFWIRYFGLPSMFNQRFWITPLCSNNDFGLPSVFNQIHKATFEILSQHHDLSQIANKLLCLQLVVYSPTTMTKD